jgi:hypothetical protein
VFYEELQKSLTNYKKTGETTTSEKYMPKMLIFNEKIRQKILFVLLISRAVGWITKAAYAFWV